MAERVRLAEEPYLQSNADARAICADGAMTLAAAIEFSGIGRSRIYELIAEGRLSRIKIGRRVLLPRVQLIELLADGLEADTGEVYR